MTTAGGGQCPLTVDLHHADPAVAHRLETLLVAEVRDLHPISLGDVEDRLVGMPGHGPPIDLERDLDGLEVDRLCPGACIHPDAPS